MKTSSTLLVAVCTVLIVAFSCKAAGRIAARYWLNREIREFVSNCEDRTSGIIGSENAHKYCDCAVDLVAEKYQNYQDAKKLSVMDIINFVNKCK
ncbi:MAG: hypothetical protein IPP31_12035 [Chitinophagaceae bacterium]|nr:hypothetical protein [Chitinophagaceae bacterium]